MEQSKDEQFVKMTQCSMPKLITSLSIPTVISMLVTAIYNITDTYFVSQLGTSASAAVGVVFSIMSIIQAVGFGLGMGSGSLVSRLLGKHDDKSASKYASTGFLSAFIRNILGTGSFLAFPGSMIGGFLAGLLTGFKGYRVTSNRESGNGRYDLFVKSRIGKNTAVIFEFKLAPTEDELEKYADFAIQQIEEKKYEMELKAEHYKKIIEF